MNSTITYLEYINKSEDNQMLLFQDAFLIFLDFIFHILWIGPISYGVLYYIRLERLARDNTAGYRAYS
jgi:hypothetical protein